MKRETKIKIIEAGCIASFLVAVLFCENADGSLNVWTLPLLSISGIAGAVLKLTDKEQ